MPVEARFSVLVQTDPEVCPASYKIGTRTLSLGYSGHGMALTTHLLLVPRLFMGRTIIQPPNMLYGDIPLFTSQIMNHISNRVTNILILFTVTLTVYSENHVTHINTLWEKFKIYQY